MVSTELRKVEMTAYRDLDVYREAARSYRRKDFEKAFELYMNLAEKGDVRIQSITGFMYLRGRGVSKDLQQARKWFEVAATKGDSEAEYYLGRLSVISCDYVAAAQWFDKAAQGGFSPAMYRLAILYIVGKGVDKNMALAIDLLENAAERRNVWAKFRLARLLLAGHAGPKGLVRGIGMLARLPANWLRLVCRDIYAEELRR